MPPLKSSLIKPSKSMLFFHIWNANFSVTPINSQMYMTKPKQVQKKLSENTGKTFSVIMPPFTSRGWAYLRKLLYDMKLFCCQLDQNQVQLCHFSVQLHIYNVFNFILESQLQPSTALFCVFVLWDLLIFLHRKFNWNLQQDFTWRWVRAKFFTIVSNAMCCRPM